MTHQTNVISTPSTAFQIAAIMGELWWSSAKESTARRYWGRPDNRCQCCYGLLQCADAIRCTGITAHALCRLYCNPKSPSMISGNFDLTYSTVKSGPCCTCMPGGTAKHRNCGRTPRAILLISALSSGDHIDAQNFHLISTRSMRTRLVTHHYVRSMLQHKRFDMLNFYGSERSVYAVRLDINADRTYFQHYRSVRC
jgi:hypothetical protein